MPTFISLKRGHDREPPKDIYMDVPCEDGSFRGTRRRISHFKYVESTNCDEMKLYAKLNEKQNKNPMNPKKMLKPTTYPQVTVRMVDGQPFYSNEDVQFDNLVSGLMTDEKLNNDVYKECLQMISTGVVDIDRVCEYGRFTGDTLLSVMIRLKQMDKVVELLQLGANAFIRLEPSSRTSLTPASLFWETMTSDRDHPSQYYEAFTMIRKQAELREQREDSDVPPTSRRNDVYMCVEDNAEEADPDVLVYEDLLGRRDCSELYCTDEANLFQDEAEEVSEDSEDSNAEDYYDRICEAYGGEEEDMDYRRNMRDLYRRDEEDLYYYGEDERDSYYEDEDYWYEEQRSDSLNDDDYDPNEDYGYCVCLLYGTVECFLSVVVGMAF